MGDRLSAPLVSAVRSLWRDRRFSAVVVLTIGIGIGGVTFAYSALHGILLSPLSLDDADRLVSLWRRSPGSGNRPLSVSDFEALRTRTRVLESAGARWLRPATLLDVGDARQVQTAWVTGSYWSTLRVSAALGRLPGEAEETAVVLSHRLWTDAFGGDPTAIGRRLRLAGDVYTVVGVLPADVNPDMPTIDGTRERNDVWGVMPAEYMGEDWSLGWLRAVGRLRPGVSIGAAQTDLERVSDDVRSTVPERASAEIEYVAELVHDQLVARVRPLILVLMVAVIVVLLLVCTNVANLQLVRGEGRQLEIAVRGALGAGRRRLGGQLMLESALLAFAGGLIGIGLGWLALEGLVATGSGSIPRLDSLRISPAVLVLGLIASAVAAVASGLYPAVTAIRGGDPGALLTPAATRSTGGGRVGRILVASQVSFSVVLLVAAGLLLQSFAALTAARPGYAKRGILTFQLAPPAFETRDEHFAYLRALEQELASIPEVRAAGFTNRLPLAGGLFTGSWVTDPARVDDDEKPAASLRFVSAGFFDAMGTPLLGGRPFDETATAEVLIDRRFAEAAWPSQDPVGRRLWVSGLGEDGWVTVRGVVEHMRHERLQADGRETIFIPLFGPDAGRGQLWVAVATDTESAALVPAVRQRVRNLHPEASIADVQTIEGRVAEALAPNRLAVIIVGLFAAVASFLAAIGLYGVVSHAVRHRTREIGVRIALGGRPTSVVLLVFRQVVLIVFAGVVVGVLLALAVTRVLDGLLFEVGPSDARTIATVAALALSVGAMSGYLPASRAGRIEPTEALRYE